MQQPRFIPTVGALAIALGCSVQDLVPVGGACTTDAPCAAGFCIREQRTAQSLAWAGGYCSEACGAVNACPRGATCVAFADGTSFCAATCSTGTACRTGYVCSAAVSACLPDCRLGWSCGNSLQCDPSSGACVVSTVVPGSIGSPCLSNVECQSGLCTPEQTSSAGTSWTGGHCTQACGATVTCPSGSACVPFEDGTAYCAAACGAGGACRTGYVCSAAVGACLPDCRLGWSCGTTLLCDAATGTCLYPTLPDAGVDGGVPASPDAGEDGAGVEAGMRPEGGGLGPGGPGGT
jgi:hypothetical protein